MSEKVPGNGGSKRLFYGVLNPVERSNEVLFGLIMVMTFTNSLSTTEAGRADVRSMLIGAVGCNLAWGIIDAVMYFMSSMAERKLSERTVHRVRTADDVEAAREIVAEALPGIILPALSSEDLERIRRHLASLPDDEVRARPTTRDVISALGVFLLVFFCTFPVVFPFIVMTDALAAVSVSNAIATALLFLAGYTLGRHSGHPVRLALAMVAIGLILVALASALGG
ncbi:VIT1/CCC1 transporter family protein [Sinorhizobium medicae]|uniref:VIT1/CCC1 transporter family protein n=1 Tax=Sinorhizobium medicae TaxID=110321 RepID=UPI0012970B24|nr:VIT1/CCC1 transporter family protein [Sinorhizobium medicae]MDX0855632.1 VIT family protein [Sinorhizobium medicae]MDX0891736.1 VIT family protein [Sinorhizobium medicae]MDX1210526.1 VIT family protein [Sinorhizobium medicae]MDX2383992.1 VIT family protein [Sinorhizobium medicae]MQV45768.1 VIT family protein [Sinorhizobium medicae]